MEASARALTLCLLFNPTSRDFRVVTVRSKTSKLMTEKKMFVNFAVLSERNAQTQSDCNYLDVFFCFQNVPGLLFWMLSSELILDWLPLIIELYVEFYLNNFSIATQTVIFQLEQFFVRYRVAEYTIKNK